MLNPMVAQPANELPIAKPRVSAASLSTVERSIETNGLVFRERHVVARVENPRHEHEYQCIGFILEGKGTAEMSRDSWTVRPGDVNVIPAGVAHLERFGAPRIGWCSLEVDQAPPEIEDLTRRAFARPVQFSRGPACDAARRISYELRLGDDLTPLSLWGLGIALLAAAARGGGFDGSAGEPRWMGRVVELLRARHAERLSVRGIAEETGVHPGHLARVFRRERGCTIGEFVRIERVERAKTLLVRNDQSIARIAVEVGFCDQAHFGRAFKAVTGATPAAYRASWRSR